MSDKSEQMRPIPDGGLKESMPSWLKRPPAWRDLPTVEERHERTLPEPDTSVIDPHSLVDVNDLPQWLQAIAARGEIPAPKADEIVSVPVQEVVLTDPSDADALPSQQEATITNAEPEDSVIATTPTVEVETSAETATEKSVTGLPSWLVPVALFIILVAVVLFYVL